MCDELSIGWSDAHLAVNSLKLKSERFSNNE